MKIDAKRPIYTRVWEQLKMFPRVLSEGSKNSPKFSGNAAAAFISAGIGAFTMMVTHHLGDTSKERDKLIWNLGSWIPGSKTDDALYGNIGSYTGKETMLLVGWLVSWLFLSLIWRDRQVKASTILFWMFATFMAATMMSWHPLFPYLPLMPRG
jgi:hypothetical protein